MQKGGFQLLKMCRKQEDIKKGKSLLKPRIFKLKAEISRERFNLLVRAHRGQGPTPYGFISTLDNDGVKVSAYLLDLRGDQDKNWYTLFLGEKGDFYT